VRVAFCRNAYANGSVRRGVLCSINHIQVRGQIKEPAAGVVVKFDQFFNLGCVCVACAADEFEAFVMFK
jgi:hypothetical protein